MAYGGLTSRLTIKITVRLAFRQTLRPTVELSGGPGNSTYKLTVKLSED